MPLRTPSVVARRRAAWLSLGAMAVCAVLVPALHVGVHVMETAADAARAHEHAHGRRTQPVPRRGHAPPHGHRHPDGAHHVHGAAPTPPPPGPERAHHHRHEGQGGDRDPTQHGRGSLEHLGVAVLGAALSVVPPPPRPRDAPRNAAAPTGVSLPALVRINAIRGPPRPLPDPIPFIS